MKRILFLTAIIVPGTFLACALWLVITGAFTQAAPAPPAKIVLYDVDAMAARMPADKDFYNQVRDQALAFYAKQHPAPNPSDNEVHESIKLAAYYSTWGDYYGERVLLDLADIEAAAENKGCNDPMLCNLQTDAWDNTHRPNTESRAVELCNEMLGEKNDGAPAAFKLIGAQTAIVATLNFNRDASTLRSNPASMQKLPELISIWQQNLAALVAAKAPVFITYDLPLRFMTDCQQDVPTLNAVIAAIDEAYNEGNGDVGKRVALDGAYFTDMAWAARGSGYANTVSNGQFETFDNYLASARQILEAAYTNYPHEPRIPTLMSVVALGGSIDRDSAEAWFQRPVKADPDFLNAYSKEWYLQPRWQGSVDDEWKFMQECVATQNWTHKIPMIIGQGLDGVAQNGDAEIFKRDDVWQLVDSTYRKYLEMYPRASKYRSYYLKAAYEGGHRDVMAEQYNLLGANRDDSILDDDTYNSISTALGH